MSPEHALAELVYLQTITDQEIAHVEADNVLCNLIKTFPDPTGILADIIVQYKSIEKWYA